MRLWSAKLNFKVKTKIQGHFQGQNQVFVDFDLENPYLTLIFTSNLQIALIFEISIHKNIYFDILHVSLSSNQENIQFFIRNSVAILNFIYRKCVLKIYQNFLIFYVLNYYCNVMPKFDSPNIYDLPANSRAALGYLWKISEIPQR